MTSAKVAVVLGSASDLEQVKDMFPLLAELGISCQVRVMSAHRTPDSVARFASRLEKEGTKVVIAVAGKAAHLAGAVASRTSLPVIGVPAAGGSLGGLDALISTVQMPAGVPVATMSIGRSGAINAAVLAAQILAIHDEKVRQAVLKYRRGLGQKVRKADKTVRSTYPG